MEEARGSFERLISLCSLKHSMHKDDLWALTSNAGPGAQMESLGKGLCLPLSLSTLFVNLT